jgi:hypothetical protein
MQELSLDKDIARGLSRFLSSETGATLQACRAALPVMLPMYGKFCMDTGGNTIHGQDFVRETDTSQDALYCHVSFH